MKVLNVQITLDPVHGGGTAERTVQMSRALAGRGVATTVLSTTVGLDASARASRASSLQPAQLVTLHSVDSRFNLFRFSPRVIRDLVTEHDVIHLMGHWNVLNTLVWYFARKLGRPYVCSPAGELVIGSRSRVRKRAFNRVIGSRILRGASGYVAITRAEMPHFESHGIPEERVAVIPNGVSPEDFTPSPQEEFRTRHGLGDSPFLLYMGALDEFKGPDLLLEAFLARPAGAALHKLLFVGPDRGGMLDSLRQVVRRAGAGDGVHFLGYLGGGDKWAAYAGAELLVIPSRHEAMSIVALEAGLAGTPVLLTDQCGFADVARIGGGKVVPASADGLYAGLADLLARPAELPAMGRALQQHVLRNFTWYTVVEQFIDLYQSILTRHDCRSLRRA